MHYVLEMKGIDKSFAGMKALDNASLMLKDATDKASGYTGGSDKSVYLGKTGKTITELRPAGAAELDGERLDVVSQGGFVEAGVDVEVIEVSGNRIVVKAI